jgi:hypothetical protein
MALVSALSITGVPDTAGGIGALPAWGTACGSSDAMAIRLTPALDEWSIGPAADKVMHSQRSTVNPAQRASSDRTGARSRRRTLRSQGLLQLEKSL